VLALVADYPDQGHFPDKLEKADGQVVEELKRAGQGELVIPAFPMGDSANHFIGINTGLPAQMAKIEDRPGIDPGALANILIKKYPGLPKEYLHAIVVATFVASYTNKLLIDKPMRVFVDQTSAKLQCVVESGEMITMWSDINPAQYL
jgi:hypothetical protein